MQMIMIILFAMIVVTEIKGLQQGVLTVVLLLLVGINKIQIKESIYI
jgi:hypothetical protein